MKFPFKIRKAPNLSRQGAISKELGKIYNKQAIKNLQPKRVRLGPKGSRPNRTLSIGSGIRRVKTAKNANPFGPKMPEQTRKLREAAYRKNRAEKIGNGVKAVLSRDTKGNAKAAVWGGTKMVGRHIKRHPKRAIATVGVVAAIRSRKKKQRRLQQTNDMANTNRAFVLDIISNIIEKKG